MKGIARHAGLVAVTLGLAVSAFGDISSTLTLPEGSVVNLDTGTISATTGDLLWNGSSLTVVGKATAFGYPATTLGQAAYNALTLAQLQADTYSTAPLSGVNVAPAWVIAVHTNGGNYAKMIINTNSITTINFTFDTFTSSSGGGGGGGGGTPTPTITEVQNNYSYISPGLPNYGIAPGSLFIVKGTNLATNTTPVLQSSASPGLPTSLNGASISVTVNGTTTTPALYYTSAAQLAAVLPSSTPVGTGTITVTVNGVASSAAQMVVVQSALGLDVATDANVNYFAQAASASPGQTIILWGSGVGGDPKDDDKTYPQSQDNLTSIPLTVYIGGIQVTPQYQGRSQYPGVDQVNVVIPSSVPVGCSVSIVAVSGSGASAIVSNAITVPVAQGGGACTDPTSPTTPGQTQSLSGKAEVKVGVVSILQSTEVTAATGKTTTNTASATFYGFPGSQLASGSNANIPSIGSCVILQAGAGGGSITGLNFGTVTLTGPGGLSATLQPVSTQPYTAYTMLSATAIPANGGAFTFTGSGGTDVGAFSTTINVPTPLVWTNQSSTTTVTRSAGQQVTWTGGAPGTYVEIGGQSTVQTGTTGVTPTFVSASFLCLAPVSAGQFTVPPYILLSLPATKTGSMYVENAITPQNFSAPGLDYAYGLASFLTDASVVYQ